MKTLYFDIIGGVSGDMTVAAFLDMGVDLKLLKKELKKIKVSGYVLKKSFVERGHVKAVKFDVACAAGKNYSYRQIVSLVKSSRLSENIKRNILKVYEVLSYAEIKAHGHKHKDIHFQQLGDVDSIVDIASACICLDILGADRVLYSAIPLNYRLAPATFELLRNNKIYFTGRLFENVTPTGMAILRALGGQAEELNLGLFQAGRCGYGAGTFDPKETSNVLRVAEFKVGRFQTEEVVSIEANIDDMNPQFFEYVFDRLFAAGALDVFLAQVYMKKTRPGFLLTVLSKSENLGKITEIVFSETTTIGVRFHTDHRLKVDREIKTLEFGPKMVRVKCIKAMDGEARFSPEYEDCKAVARESRMPISKVYEEINRKAKNLWRSRD
ncbi:MAG: nickel pincer cofactor biosynthesis protein LarC [Candidatus Omnitrophica bacterium]|nr:nickel pincer cofactor biosynthesis protein LarC [Candidatus Omnitrophota bacterium]